MHYFIYMYYTYIIFSANWWTSSSHLPLYSLRSQFLHYSLFKIYEANFSFAGGSRLALLSKIIAFQLKLRTQFFHPHHCAQVKNSFALKLAVCIQDFLSSIVLALLAFLLLLAILLLCWCCPGGRENGKIIKGMTTALNFLTTCPLFPHIYQSWGFIFHFTSSSTQAAFATRAREWWRRR